MALDMRMGCRLCISEAEAKGLPRSEAIRKGAIEKGKERIVGNYILCQPHHERLRRDIEG